VSVNVLAQLGLGALEYGVTAWGGTIQYCRDYDLIDSPTNANANAQPHYAALRINKSVSLGSIPDATAINNVFISF
jgi:hypothetical protein